MTFVLGFVALGFILGSFAVGVSALGAWMAGVGLGMAIVLSFSGARVGRHTNPYCARTVQTRKPQSRLG